MDDSRFPARASITALRDGKAEIIGYLIVANDNSAAQLAKDATKREKVAHEMFRLAVEACPSGMLMVDREGKIVLANAEIERQFGYARDELIGKTGRHAGPRAPAPCSMPRTARRSIFGRRRARSKPAPIYWACARMAANFRPRFRLIQSRSMAASWFSAWSSMSASAGASSGLKDEFVATVSHELRTPLTSIVGALGLLAGNAAGKLPDSAMRLLDDRLHATAKGSFACSMTFSISKRWKSGKVVFDFKRVEVRSLVEQAIEANRAFAEGFDVRIRLDSASVAIDVRADPDRLVQAITNLLSNAIKFSPPGEEVVVAVEARNETARISVRDHGHGVPDEFKPHIFEKFAQADATDARQKGGTGLGLSIVKQIVDRLDGAVGFEDAPGGGCDFSRRSAQLGACGQTPVSPRRESAVSCIAL